MGHEEEVIPVEEEQKEFSTNLFCVEQMYRPNFDTYLPVFK